MQRRRFGVLWTLRFDGNALVIERARVVSRVQWFHALAGSDRPSLHRDPVRWAREASVTNETTRVRECVADLLADEIAA